MFALDGQHLLLILRPFCGSSREEVYTIISTYTIIKSLVSRPKPGFGDKMEAQTDEPSRLDPEAYKQEYRRKNSKTYY